MRKIALVLPLVACGMMILGGCSLVELNEERDNQVVVAVVGTTQITKGEFKKSWEQLKANIGITDDIENDSQYSSTIGYYKQYALDQLVNDELTRQEAQKRGFYNFTDEQKAEIDISLSEAVAGIRDSVESGITFEEGLSDEEKQALIDEETATFRDENGYTDEYLRSMLEKEKAASLLYDDVTKGATADEAALTDQYNQKVASDQTSYGTKPDAYVQAVLQYGYNIYFVPTGGMRTIQQILIVFPDDTIADIAALRNAGDEEAADAAREEALKEIEDKAREALAKVGEGADFEELIGEYSKASSVEADTKGYPVNAGVTYYMPEFQEGAMALKEVGDISGLIATDYGYHILRYAEFLPEGARDYEDVKEQIREEVLQTNRNTLWSAALEEWKTQLNVKTYYKKIE